MEQEMEGNRENVQMDNPEYRFRKHACRYSNGLRLAATDRDGWSQSKMK